MELRLCLGVLSCSNAACGRLIRPKTNAASRRYQILDHCQLCYSPIINTTCTARTYHYKIIKNQQTYVVWEHDGNHQHERPPGGALSVAEEEAVDEQVSRNPNASAHVLRTGDNISGSVPLSEISQVMANPKAARYQIAQSQARLGITTSGASKGGLSVLKSLFDLQSELDGPFIINSSIHGSCFIAFQTPFMKNILHESIQAWADDIGEKFTMGRRGFVTDGDHSFFREGVLNITCVFSQVMLSWIPILYTWILRQDTAHHRPHFRHISKAIVDYIQSKGIHFEPKYLLHVRFEVNICALLLNKFQVFDFSAAQRSAHAEEYADAVASMTPGYNNLSKPSQKIEHNRFLEEALEAERGCSFHFWQSAERLKSTASVIPSEKSAEFVNLLRILVDNETTREEFDRTIQDVFSSYPRVSNWLTWWLRPNIRSMIFPVLSSLDPAIAIQVPRTSNAAEHSHSLLHSAVGLDQDLIPGIKKLFLHVKELESQYDSIKGVHVSFLIFTLSHETLAGHYNPSLPRTYRPPSKPVWEVNDVHAPDTLAALNAPHKSGTLDAASPNENHLLSYEWRSPNSCFIDNALEIWFRSYSSWPKDSKAAFLSTVPKNTFLSSLFYHYDRRFKQMYQDTPVVTFRQTLELMQSITLDRVFSKWKLYSDRNAYGCAKTWLVHAIKVRIY